MKDLPLDVIHHIVHYITNDCIAVCRLSQVNKWFYECIQVVKNNNSHNDKEKNANNNDLWKLMYIQHWNQEPTDDDNNNIQFEFQQRYELDQQALQHVNDIATSLYDLVQQETPGCTNLNQFSHVSQGWEHVSWKRLLQCGPLVCQALKNKATKKKVSTSTSTSTMKETLQQFLAANALASLNLQSCLLEWKEIQSKTTTTTYDNNNYQVRDELLERTAIMICKILQMPPDLLQQQEQEQHQQDYANTNNNNSSSSTLITNSDLTTSILDEMAVKCREEIETTVTYNNDNNNMRETFQAINTVLFQHYGISGNEHDYYNYRNSLLHHVFSTKKGIPITLAILYTCICRRLQIQVHMIGLPGHLVLGYCGDNINNNWQLFLDVFHGGRLLTIQNCQEICHAYGYPWQPHVLLQPLTPNQVLTRILNNLSNCLNHQIPLRPTLQQRNNNGFQHELYFNVRILMILHRQPDSNISNTLLDRISMEIPLTISKELLRYYGLYTIINTNDNNDNVQETL